MKHGYQKHDIDISPEVIQKNEKINHRSVSLSDTDTNTYIQFLRDVPIVILNCGCSCGYAANLYIRLSSYLLYTSLINDFDFVLVSIMNLTSYMLFCLQRNHNYISKLHISLYS